MNGGPAPVIHPDMNNPEIARMWWFTSPEDDSMSDCFCTKRRTRTIRVPIGFRHYERGVCEKHYLTYHMVLLEWLQIEAGC